MRSWSMWYILWSMITLGIMWLYTYSRRSASSLKLYGICYHKVMYWARAVSTERMIHKDIRLLNGSGKQCRMLGSNLAIA
ncbi:hypothetical protein BT63DRAFT_57303 [Microthyrium microscopicum]|uniref:Uncharacterized protein n=1 Tax=Microthyrium microscopicum TaxID=703497 RepID=A0A6A6U601_9PEZI|nr:hypothetical protein BT63DRAFT_57303 [Microthyrium microscopicum]